MIVAIDGPACAGKSTLAGMLAKELGFNSLNTGMIFRALTYVIGENNIDIKNEEKLNQFLKSLNIELGYKDGNQFVYVNGEDLTGYINTPFVVEHCSPYSQIPVMRDIVKQIQQQMSKKFNLVVEGRDIGTEVFPNAEYKFFVTASIEKRAIRRYQTMKEMGQDVSLESIKKSLEQRDYNDTHRQNSPLRQAEDAVYIDTSDETSEQSMQRMLSYIRR